MRLINPFSNIDPITNPSNFFGRNIIVEGVLNSVLSLPSQSVSIVGQRKIGKTSLLKCLFSDNFLLLHNREEYINKIQVVYIDCEQYAAKINGGNDFYSMLITETNNQQVLGGIKLFHSLPAKENWKYIINQINSKGKQLIVIFDNFEFCFQQRVLIEQNIFGDLHNAEFTWITCTINYLHSLHEEVLSNLQLDERTRNSLSNFVYEARPYVLDLLSDAEAQEMISNISSDLSDKDIQLIKSCGGNFPYFIRRAFFHLYNAKEAGVINEDLVRRSFSQEVRPLWERFWKHLSKSQQLILSSIVKNKLVESNYDVVRLIDLSLTFEMGAGKYKVFSEEFKKFIAEKNPVKHLAQKPKELSRKGHPKRKPSKLADILIVTTTKVETKSVLQFRKNYKRKIIGRKTYYDLGLIKGKKVYLTRTDMGSGVSGGSQNTIRNSLEILSPSAIIMVGIAFGLRRDKHSIGDILVSQMLMPYEAQRIGRNKIVPRGERVAASLDLLDKFKDAELNGWRGAPVRFGLFLSGEKLVDNKSFKNKLLEIESEAIGGEMEGGGLYSAIRDLGDFKGRTCSWIIVKSICDWADGKKGSKIGEIDESKRQEIAASNATRFVFHALKQGGIGD